MYAQQLPGQQWKLPKANFFVSYRWFRNTLITDMKKSDGAPKSNWILTLSYIPKRKEKQTNQKSNYLVSLLCCIVIHWGITVCSFQEPCINSQRMFGVGFRLLFYDSNNPSKKWMKLVSLMTVLRGQPWREQFLPVLWREPALVLQHRICAGKM